MPIDDNLLARLAGVAPLDLDLRVQQIANHYITQANEIFSLNLEPPKISYDLTGTTAGKAYVQQNRVKLNLSILLNPEHQQEMLSQTLPHEIAHLIHHNLYPNDREWHGARWKYIMVRLGLRPDRCHDMKVPKARKTRRFRYFCDCGTELSVGLNRHKKIQWERKNFICKYCRTYLYDMPWEEV